jgi:catechol 2,3-dioxygenase-like lactoylglutathione lyase family enzyme
MAAIPSPVPAPGPGVEAPEICRDIYGMPFFATLLVADVSATVSWYTEGLGFITLFTIPGPDGLPALVHLRRWQFQDLLVRPSSGPVSAGTGVTLSFAAVYDEIEALAERARARTSGSVTGPIDTPWNTREVTTADPDGNVVIFTAGRPPLASDRAFSENMDTWNAQQS